MGSILARTLRKPVSNPTKPGDAASRNDERRYAITRTGAFFLARNFMPPDEAFDPAPTMKSTATARAPMPDIHVIHNPAASRFEATVDGLLCVADYSRQGHTVAMTHTYVPDALRGRGVAAALVKAALDWARSQGLKVDPQCSYVDVYMQRHRETLDLLAQD
jgi:predicted GNAT family acetyltransferase